MRRMTEIKQKKGFSSAKEGEEAKDKNATSNFVQGVSKALGGTHGDGPSKESLPSDEPTEGGLDSTDDDLLKMDEPLGTFSGGSIDHEFARAYPNHFSQTQTVDLPSETT